MHPYIDRNIVRYDALISIYTDKPTYTYVPMYI